MAQDPYILLIETSAEVCSAALMHSQTILAERNIFEKNSHSKELAPMVKELLDEAKLKVADLSAVAVSGGPGSYTGLRIGASLAKALCYSANIPLIAISSLKAIAFELQNNASAGQLICSMIDARREDVYYGLYDHELNTIEESFATLDADFPQGRAEEIIFGGSGAAKLSKHRDVPQSELLEVNALARSMAQLAWVKFKAEAFEDLAYYEPNYIKSVHITTPKKDVK